MNGFVYLAQFKKDGVDFGTSCVIMAKIQARNPWFNIEKQKEIGKTIIPMFGDNPRCKKLKGIVFTDRVYDVLYNLDLGRNPTEEELIWLVDCFTKNILVKTMYENPVWVEEMNQDKKTKSIREPNEP